jgi:hypothetical protein
MFTKRVMKSESPWRDATDEEECLSGSGRSRGCFDNTREEKILDKPLFKI